MNFFEDGKSSRTVLYHFFFFRRKDTCPIAQNEGWASEEAASDLENQRFYLGQTIDDNRAPGCSLIESGACDLISLR